MIPYKLPTLFDAGNDLNQRWFVFYFFKHPETHKFKRFKLYISSKYTTAAARRDKARELIKIYSIKLKQGWNPFEAEQIQLMSVGQAIENMLELKKSSLRMRSYSTLKNVVKSFYEYLDAKNIRNLSVDEFSLRHAIDYLDWCRIHHHLSNRSLNYRRMNMKTMFNELIHRDYIQVNPFNKTSKLPVEETEIISYTRQELDLLPGNLRQHDFNLYIAALLVFYCFIRPQEMVRLKIRDVDIRKRRIYLPGKTSKNKKSEVVVIPDHLHDDISKMNLDFPPDYYVFSRHLKPGTSYIAPTRIAEAWSAWATKVGLTNRGIYALKHTGVGMAVEAGINVRDLQLQLRHSSLEMTQKYLDRFSSVPSERLRSIFPKL